mmetsp:Transcript_2916/g.8305  ORF Transcript_2916/g.8305 Transcript_2916/m.8305 type:complete len:238 (-) Transcript_2916:282-995(-)
MQSGEVAVAEAVLAEILARSLSTSRVTFVALGGVSQTFEVLRGDQRPCLVVLADPNDRDVQDAMTESNLSNAARVDGRGLSVAQICDRLAVELARDVEEPSTGPVLGIPGLGYVMGGVSTATGTVTGTVSTVTGWLGRTVWPTAVDVVSGVNRGVSSPEREATAPGGGGGGGGGGGSASSSHVAPSSHGSQQADDARAAAPLDQSWAAQMFDPRPRAPDLTKSIMESDFEIIEEDDG